MINKLGQVMLYVYDQERSLQFWTEKAGFHQIDEGSSGEMRWIEIAPENAATRIVLHNKELVAKMDPEMNLDPPSLMFFTNNLDELYQDFTDKQITVGEIVNTPSGRVFNFADNEENYFAVMEQK